MKPYRLLSVLALAAVGLGIMPPPAAAQLPGSPFVVPGWPQGPRARLAR